MCTKPRIVAQNVIYDVTTKCLPELNVFGNNAFREFFLSELRKTLQKYSYSLLGWSIVNNHFNLVLLSSHFSISTFMHRLDTVLAKHYNRINKREGVVLKSRFSSVIVQGNKLKELIRHVHLNPVRSGECSLERLNTYKWSGHSEILGNKPDFLIDKDLLLSHFSGPDEIKVYEVFIKSYQKNTCNSKFISLLREAHKGRQSFSNALSWIIGDSSFIQHVLKKDRLRKLRLAQHADGSMTLQLLRKKVEECMQLSDKDLFFQGRLDTKCRARQLFTYIGKVVFNFSGKSMADYLNVSNSAVSRMIWKGKSLKNREILISKICPSIIRAEPQETVPVL
ncbi:hypothetical protein QA601_08820 [Chitinispirillales bacterium ANBcel5]|uniref:transposase n=1 Tax=Cellulosispirillum alkaliphilum TaxID=3039283 RepID=UPI002A56247D|nr:hypothetical protein [Chitinispirillales bacterium ANBcel5]